MAGLNYLRDGEKRRDLSFRRRRNLMKTIVIPLVRFLLRRNDIQIASFPAMTIIFKRR